MTLTPSDIALLREFPASTESPQGLTPEQRRRVEDLPWGLLRNGRRTDLGDDVVEMADRVAALEDQERARRILEDRDASLSAEEYEQRAADDAALLASPKAGEILGALEREALYERHLRGRTLAQVERLRAANEDLRLTLAAEQGKAEGAPSAQWVWRGDHWQVGPDTDVLARAWPGGRLYLADPKRICGTLTEHGNARAAMIAADAALSGEATTSPSALAPQGSQTPR